MSDINQLDQPLLKRNKFEAEGLDLFSLEWFLILAGTKASQQLFDQHLQAIQDKSVDSSLYPSQSSLDLASQVLKGEYIHVLKTELGMDLLMSDKDVDGLKGLEVDAMLELYKTKIQANISDLIGDEMKRFQLLCLGVSLLGLFVQENWTGPSTKLDISTLLPSAFIEVDEGKLRGQIQKLLLVDGEEVYHLAPLPMALWLSIVILEPMAEAGLCTGYWWLARAYWIRERILDHPTGTSQQLIETLMSKITLPEIKGIFSLDQIQEISARYFIETGLHNHHFYNEKKAVENYTKAQAKTGLQWKLTGALGRRTKFQQFDVTQLVLWAKSRPDEEIEDSDTITDAKVLPDTLDLNDDTMLEKIQFSQVVGAELNPSEEDVANQKPLSVTDQCILLALCINVKNSNPSHGLTRDEMKPYVARVLENPGNWMVHTMSLILRSRLEAHKTRTVERSVFQVQALVDQFDLEESPIATRMQHIYSLLIPSKWELEKELAELFMSLGVVRSALDIYSKLEMWEQMVQCYRMLENKEKALEVVETQLERDPQSAKMLCLKGDVLSDPQWWFKAWEVSNHRFSRAMRALGGHYFNSGEYQQSVDCYLKALAINPLFENSWYICGCAAMRIPDWPVALNCFRKVTSIDTENSEAWNNLASIYIQLGKKPEAFTALIQALKHSPDNWKMWTNLMYTAIDLGHFSETIRAFTRVVDLTYQRTNEKCVDKEILSILINAISTDTIDSSGYGASRHYRNLGKLIANITEKITTDPDIWSMVAKFYASPINSNPEMALDSYLKAYRNALNHPDLLISHDIFSQCATKALDLVDAYANYGPMDKKVEIGQTDSKELVCRDWSYQSKLLLRSLVAKTRDSFETDPEHDLLVKALDDLKNQS